MKAVNIGVGLQIIVLLRIYNRIFSEKIKGPYTHNRGAPAVTEIFTRRFGCRCGCFHKFLN